MIVGVSTRAAAQSACRAGYHIKTVDYFGDYDQKRCCPNISLRRDLGQPFSAWGLFHAAWLDAGGLRGVDEVVYLANLENHPEVIAAFERRTRVLGNGARTVAAVRDWETLAASAARLGIRTPRTLPPGRTAAAGAWLAKPRRSGGGHGIRPWRGEVLRGGWLVQEYVRGTPCSVAFAADGRRAVVLGVSEQLIGRAEFGAGGFRYCGNIFPLSQVSAATLSSLTARLQDLAGELARAFGLVGVGGIDFILAGSEPVILELNPRYTGSMELVERATGASIFHVHMRAVSGDLPDPGTFQGAGGYWGKAIVFARRNGIARRTDCWLDLGVCDVPFDGESIRARSPVCTVIARGPTRDACLEALRARADGIQEDLDG